MIDFDSGALYQIKPTAQKGDKIKQTQLRLSDLLKDSKPVNSFVQQPLPAVRRSTARRAQYKAVRASASENPGAKLLSRWWHRTQ